MAAIQAIHAARTLVAFRAYSRKEVRAMWDLWLD
jgi:hypothetical protein